MMQWLSLRRGRLYQPAAFRHATTVSCTSQAGMVVNVSPGFLASHPPCVPGRRDEVYWASQAKSPKTIPSEAQPADEGSYTLAEWHMKGGGLTWIWLHGAMRLEVEVLHLVPWHPRKPPPWLAHREQKQAGVVRGPIHMWWSSGVVGRSIWDAEGSPVDLLAFSLPPSERNHADLAPSLLTPPFHHGRSRGRRSLIGLT